MHNGRCTMSRRHTDLFILFVILALETDDRRGTSVTII